MGAAKIQHINPEGLVKNPAFTNVVSVSNPEKTIYIGEQNSINANGEIIHKGNFTAQTEQTMKNIETALKAAGADIGNVIKWSVFIVQGQAIQEGFEVFQRVWRGRPNPPLVTVLFVASLAHPDFLLGIEAIAII